MKRVIDEVPSHVIEPAIMLPLPKLLDSSRILEMPDELIEAVGGESAARTEQRKSLQGKLQIFRRSNLICRLYAERTANGSLSECVHTPRATPESNNTPSDGVDNHDLGTGLNSTIKSDAWRQDDEPPAEDAVYILPEAVAQTSLEQADDDVGVSYGRLKKTKQGRKLY